MLQFQSNNLIKTDWEQFITTNQFASPFQSIEFFDFINKTDNHEAITFSCSYNGNIEALCLVTIQQEKGLKGFFSKRAIIYGGPLLSTNQEVNKKLIEYVTKKLASKVIYIETRNFFDFNNELSVFQELKWEYLPYLNFQLAFKDASTETLIAAMKYNRRREIKQSITEGASYQEATNEEQIKKLYEILLDLYKTRVKLPIPPLSYFLNLYHSTIGKVIIVEHNAQVIGGAFCLFYPNESIYTLYYCGLRDYHKKIFPTHLAIIGAIDFGTQNKLKSIDFMGAGKPGEEYGVRKYKSEFGGELVEYGRFIKITKPLLYKLGKFALEFIQKIKK